MAVTSKAYGNLALSALSGEVNYLSSTVKAMLCTSTYTPDQDAHRYKSSVTNEVTGTGYTAGGLTLASKTMVYDGPSNTVTLDAADLAWTSSTITARYAVFYVSTGTDSTSALIAYWDFGADTSSTSGTFTLQLNASGLVTFTAA